MRNLTPDTITKAFAEYARNAPSACPRSIDSIPARKTSAR